MKALGMGISHNGGSPGQPGVGPSIGDFERWLKGTLEVEHLSQCELCEGTWKESSLVGNPEGYVEKYLETGISFHKNPVWGTWRRACLLGTKRALGMEHLSLKRLRGGEPRGTSFTGDPGRYVREVSGCGHLSPWALVSIRGECCMWGGGSFTVDFDR